jgi:serine/threonine protein kinase
MRSPSLFTMSRSFSERLQAEIGGQYRILSEVGGGGMSRIFLAWEKPLARWIVLKVLPPELTTRVSVARFFRETRLAAGLQHPYVVPVLSAGQAGELLYYTMPLIEGETLRTLLTRRPVLPVGTCLQVLHDTADALAYAHQRGIAHRDVKPENIIITGRHAMVTDFGIAKATNFAAFTGDERLSSAAVVAGTPAYMAPEQIAAEPNSDHRVDLYALGVVAYEMLAGEHPFRRASPQALLAAHLADAPEPIDKRCQGLPAGLSALVMRLLEKDPASRVQSADEVLRELDAIPSPSSLAHLSP